MPEVTTADAAHLLGVPVTRIHGWAKRGHIARVGTHHHSRQAMYDFDQLLAVEEKKRTAPKAAPMICQDQQPD